MEENTIKAINEIMQILKLNYPNYISFGFEGAHQISDGLQNHIDISLEILKDEKLVEIEMIPKYQAIDFDNDIQWLLPIGNEKTIGYKLTSEAKRFFVTWKQHDNDRKEEKLLPKTLRAKEYSLLTKRLQDWQLTTFGTVVSIIGAILGIFGFFIALFK